ncbi:MAG: exodeoxyribonuclease VII small subunit [Bacteroidota bacterium]
MTYNEAITELEALLNDLRERPTDIDSLEGKVKRATELINWCRQRLKTVEGQLENLAGEQQQEDLY